MLQSAQKCPSSTPWQQMAVDNGHSLTECPFLIHTKVSLDTGPDGKGHLSIHTGSSSPLLHPWGHSPDSPTLQRQLFPRASLCNAQPSGLPG